MEKIISAILVFTLLVSTVNISFAADAENVDITLYSGGISNVDKVLDFQNENVIDFNRIEYAEDDYQTSCIPSKQQLLTGVISTQNEKNAAKEYTHAANSAFSGANFTFNPRLLTQFNTATGPTISNGANEPKFSYNTENWVDFSKKFSLSSAVRYVQIKISPDYANKMYIDSVKLDEPKQLIKKITDSVGRTITFDYQGDITTGEKSGSLMSDFGVNENLYTIYH